MKNLLAACTTALRAARLEYGGKSATRHARKHLRISNQTVVRKAGSALLAAVLAVGMVGAAVVVPAASASNVVSDQNDPSYWQALYPGSTCTKPVDSLNVSYYKLPALPSGTDYVAVIVKAGSPQSVDEFNTVFDANSTPKPAAGVTVSTSTGKDISHIIVCTITPAVQTVVTPVTPDVTQASTCGVYGTVTAKVTTGVSYVVTFNKLTGVWTVTATPASSAYKFDGESQTVTFSGNVGAYVECSTTPTVVTPVTPDVTQASECGVYGTVTTKVTTGVNYVLAFDKQTGVWTVTATPASSAYKFDGESQTVTFSGNVGAYVECPTTPTVVVPTAVSTAISCGAEGSYTLGAVEGVVYKVNGTVQQPGTYFVSDTSTVMVTATAVAPKYKLALNAPSTFPLTFTAAKDCQLPPLGLLTPKASSTPLTCDTAGSYTLVNDDRRATAPRRACPRRNRPHGWRPVRCQSIGQRRGQARRLVCILSHLSFPVAAPKEYLHLKEGACSSWFAKGFVQSCAHKILMP